MLSKKWKMQKKILKPPNCSVFLEGYTAGSSGNQLFVMLKSNKAEREKESRLVRISGSGTKISTTKTNLKHANDCTYYNDNKIVAFDENTLLKTHTYEYRGSYLGDKITCISHISDEIGRAHV